MSDVSDSDRQAAVAALTVHRQAGRLDSTEFEKRQVEVSAAASWAQIEAVFGDLPAPHPQRLLTASPVGSGSPAGGIAWGPGLAAAAPLLALILFFVTKSWLWFLMVPLLWIFTKGPGRRSG
jgi:hypothetical protein